MVMVLSAKEWIDRAAEARRLANVAAPAEARRLRGYAEECEIAAALIGLGHLPQVDEPAGARLSPTLVIDRSVGEAASSAAEPRLLARRG